MKAAASTFLLITANRIGRADFDGVLRLSEVAPRAAGASLSDAMRAAFALGGKPARATWVLYADAWPQKVTVSAGQVVGLTEDQLCRALSFEVEPFSGIPVNESVLGFREEGGGVFDVVQIPKGDRDAIASVIASTGSRLAGILHPGNVAESDAMEEWWSSQPARTAIVPVIAPPVAGPSPRRFLFAGIAMEAAAIALLFGLSAWYSAQKKTHESRNAEFAAVARELDATNKQKEQLRKDLADFEKQGKQRQQVLARRTALLNLLNTLAASRPDNVVVRGMAAEGPSSVIVTGLSLEAGAVDELSMTLTHQLRSSGWSAHPRSKVGKKSMANGGPWEFALVLTHQEAVVAQEIQLARGGSEQ